MFEQQFLIYMDEVTGIMSVAENLYRTTKFKII